MLVPRSVFSLAALVAAGLLAAACGGGNGGTGGAGGGASGAGGGGGGTLALSLSTLNNPFFVQLRDGATAEAAAKGYRLTISDAQNDPASQANAVQNFITQQVKAIILNPTDSKAIVPSVTAANAAKIPVITVDRSSDGGTVTSFIASDNVGGGRQAADELARLVGTGDVAQLQGVPGTSAARDRGKGFDAQIKTKPGIRLVAVQSANFDRTRALDVMTNLLQAHPTIKGVFAQNDEMALGAIKALGSRAGTQVKVVGFDGTPEGLAAVKAGTENADVAQQPTLLGRDAVDAAVTAVTGGQVPPVRQIPVKVVTRANVDAFLAQSGAAGRTPSASPS
jgi:ABC-type sugar transport system substrate-binding protein